jgi:hypothetical protein
MSGLEEERTNINKLIEKNTNDIKNHTNDIKIIEEKITEYKKHPSTVNSNNIVGLNKLIGNKRALINFYTQKIKTLQEQVEGGVESIEEEKEGEEEEEKEREEEKDDEKKNTPLFNKNPGDIEVVDLYKKKEGEGEEEKKTGFSETIVPKKNVSTVPIKSNTNQCPQIFVIGKKVNNKFFIPSQFPNLTKKKSLLKGGRKHMKTKGISRKGISRKGISRKVISRNKRKGVKNLAL